MLFLVAVSGVLLGARRAAFFLVLMTLIAPLHAYGGQGGVSIVEILAVGLLPSVVRSSFVLVVSPAAKWLFFLCSLICLSGLAYWLAGENVVLLDVLRDVRGAAALLVIALIVGADPRPLPRREDGLLTSAIAIGVLADIAGATFGSALGLEPTGIAAAHAERTGAIRYTDAGTLALFFAASWSAWKVEGTLLSRVVAVCAMLAVAFTSGLRVQALWAIVTLFVVASRDARGGIVRRASTAGAAGAIFAGILFLGSAGVLQRTSLASRGEEVTDASSVALSLGNRLAVPVLGAGWEPDLLNVVVGEGPHFKFFIPWFEYRGGDVWHFSVDSSPTFWFIKYGLVGLVLSTVTIFVLVRRGGIGTAWMLPYALVHNVLAVETFAIIGVLMFTYELHLIKVRSGGSLIPSHASS